MNKFESADELSDPTMQMKKMISASPEDHGKTRSNDSRSNISLSITRRKQDSQNSAKNGAGGASETLNKLVQSSVQNLSKILQRPGSN